MDDLDERRADIEAVAPGRAPSVAPAPSRGEGLDLSRHVPSSGRTAVVLGSSGVGKSTLVNALLGEERQATAAVREHDSRGRHTTTHRELFALPSGALLIDTPGIRALEVAGADEGVERDVRRREPWRPPAGSATADTPASPAARSRRRSPMAGSPRPASRATASSSGSRHTRFANRTRSRAARNASAGSRSTRRWASTWTRNTGRNGGDDIERDGWHFDRGRRGSRNSRPRLSPPARRR